MAHDGPSGPARHAATATSPGRTPTHRRATTRMPSLDVVRGVAICGILFANIGTILSVSVPWDDATPPLSYTAEQFLVQQRFFPIFSLLFGIGFGMIWTSATKRAAHPRVVLLRRLVPLALLGALHQLMHPGEALLLYGIAGIIVLLPATFIPARARTWACLALGALLLIPGLLSGGMMLIPGLFLIGFALAELRMPARFDASARPGLLLAVVAGVLAIVPAILQLQDPVSAGFSTASAVAGLAMGMCYVGLLGVALHTPLRDALIGFFAPLGRMALTNYVGATVIATLLGFLRYQPAVLHPEESTAIPEVEMLAIWGGCVVLLIVQSIASRLWLARFGQGPLEKAWRWVTWHGVAPRAEGAAR